MDHTHALDLLGGEETKLNLLDGAQRRLGVREVNVRHDGDSLMREKLVGLWEVGTAPGEREARTRNWGKRGIWRSLRRRN